jgi:hypothetical protein
LRNRSSAFQSVGSVPGGSGSFTAMAPKLAGRHRVPALVEDLHVIARHRDGGGADLDRQRSIPSGLPAMAQPVSVCHQWSITGTPSCFCAHSMVSGSARSPARNSARSATGRNPRPARRLGSSRLIARKAVGAVKRHLTLWSAITRQNVPASGVPTGLPSKTMVVQPKDQRRVADIGMCPRPSPRRTRPRRPRRGRMS